jgi:hypothetical protein
MVLERILLPAVLAAGEAGKALAEPTECRIENERQHYAQPPSDAAENERRDGPSCRRRYFEDYEVLFSFQ